MQELDWEYKTKDKTAVQSYECLNRKLNETMQAFVAKVNSGNHTFSKSLWMSERTLAKVNQKAQAFERYKKSKDKKDRLICASYKIMLHMKLRRQ